MVRARHWILTWNNPKISLEELAAQARDAGVSAFAGQLEAGESGTPHF